MSEPISTQQRMDDLDTSCCPTEIGYRLVASNVGRPDRRIVCEEATPVAWFTSHGLDLLLRDPLTGPEELGSITFDGEYIRLKVDNGTWVWRLTGRKHVHHYPQGGEPCVLLEARWPD